MISLSDELAQGFVAATFEGGFTWTLVSAFGDLLHRAEAQFGRRDLSWTPLGVEFSDQDRPQVWYPGNRKAISILLGHSAATDREQALFQLAHETIHVLAPTGTAGAPIVEEGIAALFSDEQSAKNGWNKCTADPCYLYAKGQAQQLLAFDPQAVQKIRALEPCFKNWTSDLVQQVVPQTPRPLADELCKPFS